MSVIIYANILSKEGQAAIKITLIRFHLHGSLTQTRSF